MIPLKWVPNLITMSRFAGLIIATYFLFQGGEANTILAFVLYFFVAISDIVDGYIARKYQVITEFGKLMDPIADKAYILTLYFSFAFLELISIWWVIPIAIREIGITLVRIVLVKQNLVIAAEKSGKLKAIIQNISLLFLFLLYFNIYFWEIPSTIFNVLIAFFAYAFLLAAIVLTLYSGFEFLKKNLKILISPGEDEPIQ